MKKKGNCPTSRRNIMTTAITHCIAKGMTQRTDVTRRKKFMGRTARLLAIQTAHKTFRS